LHTNYNRSGTEEFPDSAIGYEEMEVVKYDSKSKKPILMSGVFYHCASGKKPVYRGNTIFIRASHQDLITENDLPAYARNILPETNS